ncbi:MAG: TIGR00282 family metallophosphoesterase [Cetobacterium sp.]|uniref:TIGR00282 family metallophosphoesterase n=1 Tax=unclassified Cetobacterium TaxID=2630983 RepID=UPI00163BCABB|nr:TIGR00282 family metallophosphoesterase [Cetobacterium sp. 2A]MBC2856463.1 TIGR00282 family metallophosphoesterase [Cetobacterium sp. 2A]
MKVLVIGDIVGNPGRKALKGYLDKNKNNYDFIIVNGENSAAGFGITGKLADEMLSWGVDVITGGNHIWDKKEIYEYLDRSDRILRPYNYPNGVPGFGYTIKKDKKGNKVAVISLQGRVFMTPIDCPFTKVNELIEEVRKECKIIIIDFHAEATSEKIALGKYLDGKATLVYGTHTHIQTADNKILSEGTGYITDIGMTGSDNGIIGMKSESIIPKFLTSLPQRFEIAEGNERVNGISVEIDEEVGECTRIDRINLSLLELGIFE